MFKRFLENTDISKISFKGDFIPTVENRAFWDNFQCEGFVEKAEREMDYAWPIIKATDFMAYRLTGDRRVMEDIQYDRRKHLVLFAFAELKENKGRFLAPLVNGIFATCEESYWGVSAHYLDYKNTPPYLPSTDPYIDLFAAETAEHLAVIITALKKPLLDFCPDIIDRVEYELERRIKVPYETRRDFWWMTNITTAVNNWNPWVNSNVLTVFLLTERNERRIANALTKMFSEVQKYYDVIPSDGGCDEGPMYWNRAGATLFEFVYQLKIATNGKIDLTADDKFVKLGSYYKKAHVCADFFVNVADAYHIGLAPYIPLAFGYGKVTGDKELMNFCAGVWKEKTNTESIFEQDIPTMRRMIFCSEFLDEMEKWEVTYPLHTAPEVLPVMQLATVRKGDMILSAKGGHNNESHNHNDVGSFTLYENTTPILIDIGRGTYTKDTFVESTRYTKILWTQCQYHNLPIVNGVQQLAGAQYKADSFEVSDDEVSISFAGAYIADAELDDLTRNLKLSENGLTIDDKFAFTGKNKAVKETLITLLPARIENNAVTVGDKYKITASSGVFKSEFVPFNDKAMISNWKTEGVHRVTLECQNEEKITINIEKC